MKISSFSHIIMLTILCVLLFPQRTFAGSDTYSSGYFNYQIEDESIAITGYFGQEKTVEIPKTIAGYPVSSVKAGAFVNSKDVKEIHLPDTIMNVDAYAFRDDQTVIYPDRIEQERQKQDAEEKTEVKESEGITEEGSVQSSKSVEASSKSGAAGSKSDAENNKSGAERNSEKDINTTGNDVTGKGAQADKKSNETISEQSENDSTENTQETTVKARSEQEDIPELDEKEVELSQIENLSEQEESADKMGQESDSHSSSNSNKSNTLIVFIVIAALIGGGFAVFLKKFKSRTR